MTPVILITVGCFLAFAVALSLGALLGGRMLEGSSCRNTKEIMGEEHSECCGMHAVCSGKKHEHDDELASEPQGV
jgi:hypothetical protein